MRTMKYFMLLAAMLLMSVCSFAQNGNTPLKGDVNGDGKVDVADIVAILKIMKDAGGQGESKENTVTFIDRGTVLKTITGQEGTPVTAPGVSAWSGHNFVGWNENESAGIGRQVITEIGTSDVTYYAQWEEVQEQTTYYWYVGQTNPSSMTSISPIVTDNSSPGWREIGTTLPNYSSSNKLWNATDIITTGESFATQYIVIPAESSSCPRDGAGNDASTVDMYTKLSNVTISGVTYKVYASIERRKKYDLDTY